MNVGIESILLLRHARSTANDDPAVYRQIPDHAIPLAEPAGDAAALAAADRVAALGLDPAETCSWTSTYLRCAQTEALVLGRAFGAGADRIRRRGSFLLREQEFGDWDGLDEAELAALDPVRFEKRRRMSDLEGRFYFRFPGGESRADVVQRMAIFIGKIHRSRYPHHLVFLHGVTQRAFRMAWLNLSPAWFEHEPNPANASVLRLHRDEHGEHWRESWLHTAR